MGKNGLKTVWILGAGFSRSLGGPLLTDLLSEASVHRVTRTYELNFKSDGDMPELVALIYGAGAAGSRSLFESPQWEDAEGFLERLDLAVSAKNIHEANNLRGFLMRLDGRNHLQRCRGQLHQLVGDAAGLERLRALALKLLCAECAVFMETTTPEHEKWAPYTKWVKSLDANDTVLTFNYDCVIEETDPHEKHTWVPDTVEIESDMAVHDAKDDKRATVLKLHGSLSWTRVTEEVNRQRVERFVKMRSADTKEPMHQHALWLDPERLAIAVPGPSKRLAVAEKPLPTLRSRVPASPPTSGPLASLWRAARGKLADAQRVFFVGYRMPPSDALSRDFLLTSLRRDLPTVSNGIFCVLGENVNHPDVVRVTELLRPLSAAGVCTALPFRAEDFCDVKELYGF
jgi:hypothetical protein